MARQKSNTPVDVSAIIHKDAKRKNIPTQEMQSIMTEKDKQPVRVAYEKRNPDLDPQLIWRGKYDGSDELQVLAPPLFTQEKVKPQVLIDDLKAFSKKTPESDIPDLFADFNGLPSEDAKTEFYQHDCNWQNRMILGDSLQVMASLAVKEGMRGQVQCIYIDPPYGIKFNSNFQWSTTTRDVKDGKDITREPEQVKAFRDTWRDGIHSYLSYLRDRLLIARDLLSETGSIFVQIGDENVHRVRSLMDEVFGEENFVVTIYFRKTTSQNGDFVTDTNDYLLWYTKNKAMAKFRPLQQKRDGYNWVNYDYVMNSFLQARKITYEEKIEEKPLKEGEKVYRRSPLTSTSSSESTSQPFTYHKKIYFPGKGGWKTNEIGFQRLVRANRIEAYGSTLAYRRYTVDFPFFSINNSWTDTASGGYGADKIYVVQTNIKVIQRCILMTTDPGDLVLDPTCGSGTTAYVAEQWGRRWVTIDTSRVALALTRARIMGARYPYYLLADSAEGQQKEGQITGAAPKTTPTANNIRKGFVYERVPHITLKSIANNAEIDVIHDKFQQQLEQIRAKLNAATGQTFEEWELPCEPEVAWSEQAKELLKQWWKLRINRQHEMDESIVAKAEIEHL